MTRQRKFQLRHERMGLCRFCPRPAVRGLCRKHRQINRDRCRAAYRRKHGIPLQRPLHPHRGRKRVQ